MELLDPKKKQDLIRLAAEHGIDATAIRLHGQFVFYLWTDGELVFDDALDEDEVRDYLEGLRQ